LAASDGRQVGDNDGASAFRTQTGTGCSHEIEKAASMDGSLTGWEEAVICYKGEANLSTVVMLGSLLEGALLAKCLQNDAAAQAAAHAPKDRGHVKSYDKWTLYDFISRRH
jgi:hypothetical protein